MSYLSAAAEAQKAERAAQAALGHLTEYADRQQAEAIARLASAVKLLSEQLHRDS